MADETNQEPSWSAIARAVFVAKSPDGEAPAELMKACEALPELRAAVIALQHDYDVHAFADRAQSVLVTARAASPEQLKQRFHIVSITVGSSNVPPAVVGTASPAPAKPIEPSEALLHEALTAHVMAHTLATTVKFLGEQFAEIRRQRPHLIDSNPVVQEWYDVVLGISTSVTAGTDHAPVVLAEHFRLFRPQDEGCVRPPEERPASTARRPPFLAFGGVAVVVLIVVTLATWSWTILLGGGAR